MGLLDYYGVPLADIVDAGGLADAAYPNHIPPSGWNVLNGNSLSLPLIGTLGGAHFSGNYYVGPIWDHFASSAIVFQKGSALCLSFRGTDTNDIVSRTLDTWDYRQLLLGGTDYLANFEPLLTAIQNYVANPNHGVTHILVTGHSLGAAAVNILRDHSSQYGALFASADYVAFETPLVAASSTGILNFGFENDWVFKALDHWTGIPQSPDYNSTTDNIVYFDNNYYTGFPGTLFDPFYDTTSHGMDNIYKILARLKSSYFYHEMTRDSNVVFVGETLSVDSTVADLETQTSSHLGENTYYVGRIGVADIISGGIGSDAIEGFSGSDTLSGGAGNDRILGGNDIDFVSGGDGNDSLNGGSGDDHIDGSSGDDLVIGGSGSDIYNIGLHQGYDVVDDQAGGDQDKILFYGAGAVTSASQMSYIVSGHDLSVTAHDSGGSLVASFRIKGMDSDAGRIEKLDILSDDDPTHINDTIDLGKVWEQLTEHPSPPIPTPVPPSGDPQPAPPSLSGSFTYIGTPNGDTQALSSGHDVAAGLAGDDALGGGGSDDTLLGNAGSDVLNGGDGDDLLIDDRVQDGDASLGSDYLDGGANNDTFVFYGAPAGGTDQGYGGGGHDFALVDLTDRSADWRIDESGSAVQIHPQDPDIEGAIDLHDHIETIAVLFGSGDDDANGGNEDDYLDGGDGNDDLDGGDGKNSLIGGDGNDSLRGSSGDWLDGGSDRDYADIDLGNVSTNLTFIEDEARSAAGFTFQDGTHVQNVERFKLNTGSGNDQLWFGTDDTSITAGGGNDVLTTQGHGEEDVDGGLGNDRLVIDYSWATDHVRTQWNTQGGVLWTFVGRSEAQNSAYVTAQNVERFVIKGGPISDSLSGRQGDDILTGGDGNDGLQGGGGNDTLLGGEGNDSLDLAKGRGFADGGNGVDAVLLSRVDTTTGTVYDGIAAGSANGFTLADGTFVRNVEALHFSGGQGPNRITLTGQGNNYIDLSAAGTDNVLTLNYSWTNLAVTTHYDTGQYEWDASTSDGRNSVRVWPPGFAGSVTFQLHMIGGSSDDILQGYDQNDTLEGGAGNDAIDGGEGIDVAAYDGADAAIRASLAVPATNTGDALGDAYASIEGLQGSAFADALTGDRGDNVLSGGAGADTLNGSVGVDRMTGGEGNDLFYVDNTGDQTSEAAGGGSDTVFTATSYALGTGQSVELLATTSRAGTSAINLSGNALAQRIDGNNGNNALTSGGGGDTLYGFLGNDSFIVSSAADKVYETAGQGSDTVFASVGYTLLAGQSVDLLATTSRAGTTQITLTGNEQAQRIDGNYGVNGLYGGDGNDTLYGFDGNDRLGGGNGRDQLDGGVGNDVFAYSAVVQSTGAGRDLIQNINFAVDRIDLQVAVTGIDTKVTGGALNESGFDANLAAAIGAGQLAGHHALLFDPGAGTADYAGHLYLIVDVNGTAGYQAGADYVIELANAVGTLVTGDFI